MYIYSFVSAHWNETFWRYCGNAHLHMRVHKQFHLPYFGRPCGRAAQLERVGGRACAKHVHFAQCMCILTRSVLAIMFFNKNGHRRITRAELSNMFAGKREACVHPAPVSFGTDGPSSELQFQLQDNITLAPAREHGKSPHDVPDRRRTAAPDRVLRSKAQVFNILSPNGHKPIIIREV